MKDTISKIKRWLVDNNWLTIILLASIFLRFYHADYQSFWLDEVLSMNDTKPEMSFKQFYESVLLWEAFPHLYFLLLKWFMLIFGYSTMQARIFSAIIGVFGVYAIYLLGKELRNKRTGLIAAAITCVSIYHIIYSQEVRPYGMLFLFTVLSFYRMVIFLKKTNYKNAIYYGVFSGLMMNSHFFGLLTLFSQFIVILFFAFKTPKNLRISFIKYSIVAGIATILLMIPTYEPLLQIMKIKSFWIPKPNPDSFTVMFKEFFGNSELLLFVINCIILYYIIQVLKQKTATNTAISIIKNKLIFSFIILFSWLIVSILIPMIKSYTDVSMILARYFINIVPIFIIVIAVGIDLIKTKIIKNLVFSTVLIFSLIDIFIVKDYYNKPSKCQMRELTNEIKARNDGDTKLVVFYNWVFPFFFEDRPDITIEGKSFEEYIDGMRKNIIDQNDFWYANVNPYNLSNEDEEFLKQNFIEQDKIEYFDAWAYHYVSKKKQKINSDNNLDLKIFQRVKFDSNGSMTLFEKTNTVSSFIDLDRGNYELQINGNSFPSPAINNENAHIKIKLNGNEIANFYLSDDLSNPLTKIQFSNLNYERVRFQIIYDNDISENGKDRNAIIHSIKIKKR